LIRKSLNDQQLSDDFRANGLDIAPLSRYSIAQRDPGFLFGFTAFEPRAITRAVEQMAAVMDV
jgi:DNA-binding transcriptional MocR family regulator